VTTINPKTIPDNKGSTIFFFFYLNPTLACQTKANKKNKIGITGKISTSGLKAAKNPGNLLNNNISIKTLVYI
jgi:hypothetical protein